MIEQLCREILHPDKEFSPVPFWFFNDMPDEDKIRKQLTDYVDKGVNAIVLHPRIGVPVEIGYLSKEYFKAVRFIVKTADELGMKIVLYDEGMYPSGSAHGMVVAQNLEYASKGIKLATFEEIGDGDIITRFKDGMYLVYTYTKGTIRGIHFGEDDGENGAPQAADILNPEAVEAFIRITHDSYYEELKEYFGSTIIAFFTDEPCALGRNAGQFREWLPGLEKEILAEGGQLEDLRDLYVNNEKKANTTIQIYHRLIKKHLREIFYRRLSDWCENHNIALMGHPEVSDDVEEELYFHIPGQDLIMRRVSPESGGLGEFDSVQAKLSADIARHLGRRRNANECFGVCFRENIPWYFKAEDMKWYIDWLGIRGVNMYVPHAFYYSIEGARKEERPPDVGPHNIWWNHYKKFSDYMKRLSYLMTDSYNHAKIAVLCDNNRVPYKKIACLYEQQIEFNYLPIALLSECKYIDSKMCIAGYEYEAVLNVTDVKWDELVGDVVIYHKAEELLAENVCRDIQICDECRALRVTGLDKYNTSMYLFVNEGADSINTKVIIPTINEDTSLIEIDLWSGDITRISLIKRDKSVEFTLHLQPRQTTLIVLDNTDKYAGNIAYKKPLVDLGDFTDKFTLVEKKYNKAEYEMELEVIQVTGNEVFSIQAEEMVECYCNDKLADVGFWAPYQIKIGRHLKSGKNKLKLIVTGNAANMYCDVNLPYGLINHK